MFLSPSNFSLGHQQLEELNHNSSQDKIHHLYRMGLVLLRGTMLAPFFCWNYSQMDELSHPTKSFWFFPICFLNRDCNSCRDKWPKKAPEVNNRFSVSLDESCGAVVFLLFYGAAQRILTPWMFSSSTSVLNWCLSLSLTLLFRSAKLLQYTFY